MVISLALMGLSVKFLFLLLEDGRLTLPGEREGDQVLDFTMMLFRVSDSCCAAFTHSSKGLDCDRWSGSYGH